MGVGSSDVLGIAIYKLTKMKIKIVKQDCWLGLYWKTVNQMSPVVGLSTTWYLCVVPCCPIIWTTFKGLPPPTDYPI